MDALGLATAIIAGQSMGSPVARHFWESTLSKLTDPVDPGLVRQMIESVLVQPVPQDFVNTSVSPARETCR